MGVQVGGKGGEDVVEWYLRLFNLKNFMVFFYDFVCRLFVGCFKIEFVVDIVFQFLENFRCSV